MFAGGVHNPGVCLALLKKFYADATLSWILETAPNTTAEDGQQDDDTDDYVDATNQFLLLSKRYTDIHTFRDLEAVTRAIESNAPLSILQNAAGAFFVQYKSPEGKKLNRLHLSPNNEGLSYLPTFTVGESTETEDHDAMGSFSPCLAVPVQPREITDDHQVEYAVISESWCELNADFQWVLPGLFGDV